MVTMVMLNMFSLPHITLPYAATVSSPFSLVSGTISRTVRPARSARP